MIEFRPLRREELDDWFKHCAYVFGGGRCDPALKAVFVNHYYMDPSREPGHILVAVDDGAIVSTVRIFYRRAYFFGQEVSVGGIGEVSTKPEYQGRGLAHRLLEDAIKQMRERRVAISMLRGTRGIYSRLGWRPTTAYAQLSVAAASDELSYTMRPVELECDAAALQAIHKQYSSRFNGAFAREDEHYWKLWVRAEGRHLWLVEDRGGRPIAYVSFQYHSGRLLVNEFGAPAAHERLFDPIVGKLCAMIGKERAEVRFESLIRSDMPAVGFEKSECNMFMLLSPLPTADGAIESTEQLIGKLTEAEAAKTTSDVLFWGIDSF